MEADEYVKKLDELNRLRDSGIIDENEYNKQINLLGKQDSKKRKKYQVGSINKANDNILGFLISFICIICAIGMFQKYFYNGINKEFTNPFKYDTALVDNHDTFENNSDDIISRTDNYDDSTFENNSESTSLSNNYDYNTFETNYKDVLSEDNYDYNIFENSFSDILESNYDYNKFGTNTSINNDSSDINYLNGSSNTQTQTEAEVRETYNINITKNAKIVADKDHIDYALTVLNYQTESNNSELGQAEQGEQWVIVNMKFENTSNSTVIIDKNDFCIVDGANRFVYRPCYNHLNSELETIEVKVGQNVMFSVRFIYYKEFEMSLRYYNIDFDPLGYNAIQVIFKISCINFKFNIL